MTFLNFPFLLFPSSALAFHPIHHSLLVTGSSDGALLHWSLESSTPENPIHVNEGAHEGSISSVAWHPLGHLLATGSSDFTTRFWERGRPGEESIVEDLNSGDMEKKLLNKKKAMVGTDWDSEYREGTTMLSSQGFLSHYDSMINNSSFFLYRFFLLPQTMTSFLDFRALQDLKSTTISIHQV